jgi:hypothetical protein
MKSQELLEQMEPLAPADFFTCHAKAFYSESLASLQKLAALPDLSFLLDEPSFGSVTLGWNERGLLGRVVVDVPLTESCFPDYTKGDSFELLVDTRDFKKAGFVGRFCHHFVFLAQEVQGILAEEVTRFRSDDKHALCASSDLVVKKAIKATSYELLFSIDASALHGYDPTHFSQLGVAYRIHRAKGAPQHFPCHFTSFDVVQHPSLWASIELIH